MLERLMLEASKNRLKMMPKWIPNPSNIDEKSIENSRLEKGRPKIEKNRRLERPKVENLAPGVQ